MAWGTDFNSDIFISRQTFENISDVKNRIEYVVEEINNVETILFGLICSSPTLPNDYEMIDNIHSLKRSSDEYFQIYKDYITELYKLQLYYDYLKYNK